MMKKDICARKQVERYLLNQMNEVEEADFQNHLSECKACNSYLTSIRTLSQFMGEELHTEDEQPAFSTRRVGLLPKYWMSIAASLLVLVGVGLWWNGSRRASVNTHTSSIEHRSRAHGEQADLSLLFPDKEIVWVDTEKQPLIFRWNIDSPYTLIIKSGTKTLLDIQGNASCYRPDLTILLPYKEVEWTLLIGKQTFAGKILFEKQK